MRVTLSFDNGPTPGVTDAVLDILGERGLRAWFFVVGARLADHRHLAERAYNEGHRIGNHTFSHTIPLGDRPGDEAIHEIVRTEVLIDDLATIPPSFRPFGRGGAIGPHLVGQPAADHLMEHGYTVALWNNVPGDWHDAGWVETCLATLASQDWSVVVLHDIAGACLPRLAEFLDRLCDLDSDITLEFPMDCYPISAGRPTTSFSTLQLASPYGCSEADELTLAVDRCAYRASGRVAPASPDRTVELGLDQCLAWSR